VSQQFGLLLPFFELDSLMHAGLDSGCFTKTIAKWQQSVPLYVFRRVMVGERYDHKYAGHQRGPWSIYKGHESALLSTFWPRIPISDNRLSSCHCTMEMIDAASFHTQTASLQLCRRDFVYEQQEMSLFSQLATHELVKTP